MGTSVSKISNLSPGGECRIGLFGLDGPTLGAVYLQGDEDKHDFVTYDRIPGDDAFCERTFVRFYSDWFGESDGTFGYFSESPMGPILLSRRKEGQYELTHQQGSPNSMGLIEELEALDREVCNG